MALDKWSSRAARSSSIPLRKWLSASAFLRRILNSGLRRNDGRSLQSYRPALAIRIALSLVSWAVLLWLAACNVTVQPEAQPTPVPGGSEAQLLATATAVAPSAPELRARLEEECGRYGRCDGPTPWSAIVLALEQRPLELPVVGTADTCPVTRHHLVEGYPFEVFGEGPVYSLFYILTISTNGNVGREHNGWHWNKVVWARDPQYKGPIVMRGRQLNGTEILRFQSMRDGEPSPELAHASLHVPAYTTGNRDDAPGWEDIRTWVVVRAPGCYGVQIDGIGFSTTIVFEVFAP